MKIINKTLNDYFSSIPSTDNKQRLVCQIAQLAQCDIQDVTCYNAVVQSFLRFKENLNFKNKHSYVASEKDLIKGITIPSFQMDLLFIADYTEYNQSLNALWEVIRCFKQHSILEIYQPLGSDVNNQHHKYRASLIMNTPDLDIQQSIWNLLGGKLYPSVLYTVQIDAAP